MRDNADLARYTPAMASPVEAVAPPPHGASLSTPKRRGMSRATKILIVVAALLVVGGLLLKLLAPSTTGTLTTSGGAQLLDAQGQPIPNQEQGQEGAASDWAPGLLKMGFSFFVCFAMGYAARKFLKIGLVVAGVAFGLLFLASHLGYVQVNWQVMSDAWDGLWVNAKGQFDSMKAFITGSLPAAGMGAVGLYAGFRQG